MTEREKIIEHINKIDLLSRQSGNEWLLLELKKRFGSIEKIDDIYEYCIERNVREQAEQFYKDFPIKPIISGLKEDFVRMEFFHRKNDFNEFSMTVYQQVERITNEVCLNSKLSEAVSKLFGYPAYIAIQQQEDGTWKNNTSISDRNMDSKFTIAHLLFGKDYAKKKSLSTLPAQWAVDKIYCVLYFLCYQAKLRTHEYDQFTEYKELYKYIYQFRNLNHRGSTLTDDQKKIIEKIRPQQGIYYFKFMQALLFYVEGVAKGLSNLDELYNYSTTQSKLDVKLERPKIVGFVDLPEERRR